MPTTVPVREFDFLRLLRGRFNEPLTNKVFLTILFLVFGIAAPALFVWVLLHDAIPINAWSPDQWTLAALIPCMMILGLWIFVYIGGEYEFTGDQVTLRRRGIIVGQMRFDDVMSVDYSKGHKGHKWFTLYDGRHKLIVIVFPELDRALRGTMQEYTEIKKTVA